MANQSGRPIAPARKLVAAVLGTLAVFVMVFGLGLSSWAIVVLGLAVLALSIALGMVNVVRRGARAWVSGTAQVKAVSDPPVSSAYGRAELQLVVVAPGLPVTEVLVRDPRVPVEKWPRLGETLPVTVDVDDMRRVRIDWLNAPDHVDPPPPAPSYEADTYPDPLDDYDDDLLGEPEPPPWAARERQWAGGPDEPPPPPPPGVADAGDMRDSPVVVRETPQGPVVEGQFVDTEEPPPLPRRARSGPIPSPSPPADDPGPPAEAPPAGFAASADAAGDRFAPADAAAAGVAPADSASAEPPGPRPAGHRPSPRPRAADAAAAAASAADTAGAAAASAATATVAAGATPAPDGTDAPPRPAAPEQRPAPESRDDAGPAAATDTDAPAVERPLDVGDPAPAAADTPSSAEPTQDPEIDLPLDGDPEPPPEMTDPAAREAVATGLMAPPATGTTPPTETAQAAETAPPDETNPPDETAPPAASERRDATPPDEGTRPDEGMRPAASGAAVSSPPDETAPGAETGPGAEAGPGVDAAPAATAAADVVPEVKPSDPPVISGVDAPPSDAAVTAAAAGAAAGAFATHTANGRAQPGADEQRGPWSDLDGGYEPDDRADEVITAYPSARPGSAGAIHGVGITVLVTNLDRSIAFYRDMLGFFEIDRGPGSAVLASGDTRLVLRAVHDLSGEAGRLIYLNLEVGDVEAVYQELKAKGVVFVHAPRAVNRGDKLELWSATFTDPDRHNIAISQWRAAR